MADDSDKENISINTIKPRSQRRASGLQCSFYECQNGYYCADGKRSMFHFFSVPLKNSEKTIWCYKMGKVVTKVWKPSVMFTQLIIKITISSLVIGLKKAYFPLIRLPSCYRTVCYWIVCYWTVCYRTVEKANHIQRCSLKQAITFKFVITCACACACFCVSRNWTVAHVMRL